MTATPDPDDFASAAADLQRAHLLGSLTASERARLREACGEDAALAREVAADLDLHDLLSRERGLLVDALRPVSPSEEADETMTRMLAASGRAEAELRARLLHAAQSAPVRAPRLRLRTAVLVAVAVAAAVWIASALGAFGGPPSLQRSAPRDERAGGELSGIVIAPQLSASERSLSWGPVWHAHGYEVVVLDGAGKVVLQRGDAHTKSTQWELTTSEFETLRQRLAPLFLRVRALDSSGLCVTSSGDLPLTLK